MSACLYFALVLFAAILPLFTAQHDNSNNNVQSGSLCETENCGMYSECIVVGNEGVCQCLPGFYSSGGSQRDCRDRNECALQPCGAFSTCFNSAGSYTCRCLGAYISDTNDDKDCRPSNANFNCNFRHSCGINSRCAKLSQSGTAHRCSCEKGYNSGNMKNCVDRNECSQLGNIACPASSRCYNTQGTYSCTCDEGFEKFSDGRCLDIDECDNRPCGANAACLNTYGSYECNCYEGYLSRGRDGTNCAVDPNADPAVLSRERENRARFGYLEHEYAETEGCSTAKVIAAVTCAIFLLVLFIAFIHYCMKKFKKSKGRPEGPAKNRRKHINSISARLTQADANSDLNDNDFGNVNLAFDTDTVSLSSLDDRKSAINIIINNNFEDKKPRANLDMIYLDPPPYYSDNLYPLAAQEPQFAESHGARQTVVAQINRELTPQASVNPAMNSHVAPTVAQKPPRRIKKTNLLMEELKTNNLFQVHKRQTGFELEEGIYGSNGDVYHNDIYGQLDTPAANSDTCERTRRLTNGPSHGMTNGYITPTYAEVPHRMSSEDSTPF